MLVSFPILAVTNGISSKTKIDNLLEKIDNVIADRACNITGTLFCLLTSSIDSCSAPYLKSVCVDSWMWWVPNDNGRRRHDSISKFPERIRSEFELPVHAESATGNENSVNIHRVSRENMLWFHNSKYLIEMVGYCDLNFHVISQVFDGLANPLQVAMNGEDIPSPVISPSNRMAIKFTTSFDHALVNGTKDTEPPRWQAIYTFVWTFLVKTN